MRISENSHLLALAVGAWVGVLMPSSGAMAQPQTCPAPGASAVVVDVTSPATGSDVEGRVEVRGRFSGPAPVFQVELFVGDSRKDAADIQPPATAGSFTLAWDTAVSSGGPATLRVVACGGDPAAGSLVRGSVDVNVDVAPTAAPAETPVALTPVPAEGDGRASAKWVALALGGPGLLGLGYALGVRPARRRRTPPAHQPT